MAARLMAVAGPLEGSTFAIPDAGLTIGRDPDNALCIADDRHTSRRHAAISEEGQLFTLRDVSGGHTFVNGIVAAEHPLEHGDEIKIGRSVFLFVAESNAAAMAAPSVDLDEGHQVHGSARIVRKGDALYLDREALLATVEQSDRSGRLVRSALKACRAVLAAASLRDLQRHLLEAVLDAIPAERAAILLGGDSEDEFASTLHWRRRAGECAPFRIPRAIIRHVLSEGTALCINDASYTVWSSKTSVAARLTSMIAVPLPGGTGVCGAIYGDVSNPDVRFEEGELQLLTGIADLSAAPLAASLRLERLQGENERLVAELAGVQPLVGRSERMQLVHRVVVKVAVSDSTVLILGASGTGKELVARAIHRMSPRSAGPFVAVNCAAVIETLLESEFFGHEKGAFTGAYAQKKGKFEEAGGGTVFLDEVAELAPPLQAKLLRVLQEREFERVGGTRPIKMAARVIAATNRNLDQEIRRGAFREDLFYRLNVVAVTVPDLRERKEDIPLLATHFLRKHGKGRARRVTGFSEQSLACLAAYDWPGNVRELENAIERAIVLGTTEQILPDDLPESVVESGVDASRSVVTFHETIRDIKKQLVVKALEQAKGSHPEAARILGVHPNNLHRLLRTLNLKSKQP